MIPFSDPSATRTADAFYELVRWNVDQLMWQADLNFAQLARLLTDANPRFEVAPNQLRRLVGLNQTRTADIPFVLVAALCDVFRVDPSRFTRPVDPSAEMATEVAYEAALLNVTEDVPNPLYTILSRFPTLAGMPAATADLVHRLQFPGDPGRVAQHNYIATRVRAHFEQADDWNRPRVENFVSRADFLTLVRRPATDADAATIDVYLRELRKLIDGPLRYELYLVEGRHLRGTNTRLMAAGRVVATRSVRRRNTFWRYDACNIQAFEMSIRSIPLNQVERLTSAHIDVLRRLIG